MREIRGGIEEFLWSRKQSSATYFGSAFPSSFDPGFGPIEYALGLRPFEQQAHAVACAKRGDPMKVCFQSRRISVSVPSKNCRRGFAGRIRVVIRSVEDRKSIGCWSAPVAREQAPDQFEVAGLQELGIYELLEVGRHRAALRSDSPPLDRPRKLHIRRVQPGVESTASVHSPWDEFALTVSRGMETEQTRPAMTSTSRPSLNTPASASPKSPDPRAWGWFG